MSNQELFKSIEKVVEQMAGQNDSIDQVLDKIVEHVSSQPGANERSDWEEIMKTAESLIVGDLTYGSFATGLDVATPNMTGNSNSTNPNRELQSKSQRNS